jgi:hypothetical protein
MLSSDHALCQFAAEAPTLGRTMALCAHPFAAWRLLSTSGRMLILAIYAATSFVIVLSILLLILLIALIPPTGAAA